ncbi:tetratricopeptide repeat protein [Desulfococcaceae bacterium HSG8]|nr:tetratricopeptide repeat protein [Desulfococcaceae bacterium HSG8]
MSHKKKKETVSAMGDKSPGISRQTAVLLSFVMLVIGFIGGAIFGVMKTDQLSESKTATTPQPTARMFETLEGETIQNPQNVNAWVQLGNAYFDADQYQKAIAAYEKSLTLDPGNPNVWTDLGVMYRRNKQPRKAVEAFSKAMSADPKHEISRMNKGIVLLHDLNDEQGAIKAWEALLEINPLAVFGDGQTVDERVRHYREGHDKEEGAGK